MTDLPARKRDWRILAGFVLIVVAGGLAYSNSLHGAFVFDDYESIETNASIRSPATALKPPRDTPVAGRPLVNLTFALNYAAGQLNPTGYHIVNILIHVLLACVLFALLRRLIARAGEPEHAAGWSIGLALAAALIWELHPLQTESVSYVSQRTESLMGLFFLLTLYCAVRGTESPRGAGWHILAVLCCALGMLCKEVMAVAPLMVLLIDRALLAGTFKRALQARWKLYAGLAATWLITMGILISAPRSHSVGMSFARVPPLDYALTQAGVLVQYLRLAIHPDPLTADYNDWPIAHSVADVAQNLAIAAALLIASIVTYWRRMWVGLAGLWFFLILAPTSSIVPISSEIVAERRMYLPLAAIAVLVATIGYGIAANISDLLKSAKARPIIGGVLCAACCIVLMGLTISRNKDYQSAQAFWTDAVRKRPSSDRAHYNLGNVFEKAGNSEHALAEYQKAIELNPKNDLAGIAAGNRLMALRRPIEAEAYLAAAVQRLPDDANRHFLLGYCYEQQFKSDMALREFEKTIQLNPADDRPRGMIGSVLMNQLNRPADAAPWLRQALQINPNAEQWKRLLSRAAALPGNPATLPVQRSPAGSPP